MNRLDKIKTLHDEATNKAPSNKYDDIDRVQEILQKLFQKEHTDWLIEQAEILEMITKIMSCSDYSDEDKIGNIELLLFEQ